MTNQRHYGLLGRPLLGDRQDPAIPREVESGNAGPSGQPLPHPGGIPERPLGEVAREQLLRNAERAAATKPPERRARFGVLYDSLGTQAAWRHLIDYMASGTITPSTSAPVSVAINRPAASLPPRLERYPGSLQAYLCVRLFAYSSSGTTATGALSFVFYDQSGNPLPLGVYSATNPYDGIMDTALLSPSPITDPSNLLLGTLSVSMTNGGTPVALAFQMGFSLAYLLPSARPLEGGGTPYAVDRPSHPTDRGD